MRSIARILALSCFTRRPSAVAFVSLPVSRPIPPALESTVRLFSSPDDDAESKRMDMVRSLQKAFYQPNEVDEGTRPKLDESTGILTDLPLWRVGWVETPGLANCLNVHEGQYTHMFETILSGPQPHYFGHLHLPGGFKSARTEEARFDLKTWRDEMDDDDRFAEPERSAVVGALMRISDHRRTEDGRLVILAHAVERFVVDRIAQHFPYSVADVQVLPDAEEMPPGADENFSRGARAAAVRRSFMYHDYECDRVRLPLPGGADYLPAEGIPTSEISKILPFAFYSSDDSSLPDVEGMAPESLSSSPSSSFLNGALPLERRLKNGGILRDPLSLPGSESTNRGSKEPALLETLLWLALDDFCRCADFVLPREILCLMPPDLDYLDMDPPAERLSPRYPDSRRQLRLSYLVPILIENFPIGAGMRQAWIDAPSTQARLSAVLERFEAINNTLLGRLQM